MGIEMGFVNITGVKNMMKVLSIYIKTLVLVS